LIEINSENLHALPIARSEVVLGDWSIDATFNPLENDEDPLGQGFSITSVTQGTYGFVTTVGTTITYDSHSIEDGTHCITDELFNELKNTNSLWIVGQCGTRSQVTVDTFTYTITNEFGSSSTATDVIVVKPPTKIFIQSFPQSEIIQMTTIENDAAITTLNDPVIIDVLANDGKRSSGEILSVTHGSNGQTSTDGSTVTYTPTTNFVGVDSFDYTSTATLAFTDPNTGQSFSGTVPLSASVKVVVYDDGIQLAPVPIATSDSVAAIQGELIEINVLDNDLNPGDDTLTIVSLSQGFSGETSTNGNTVTYQSTIEFEGEDSFNYAITNSIGRTSNAQVTIFVNSAIDADGDGLNNIIDTEMFTPSNEFSIPIQDVSGTIVSRNENKVTVKPDNSHFENGLSIATEPTSQKNNDSLITMCGSLSNIGIAANTVLHTTCTNDGISLFVDEGSVHVEFDLNSDAPVSNILNVGDELTFDPSTLTMTILTNPISFSWNSVVFEMASFQTITLDTNPPTFEGPDKIVEEAEGSQGAHVTFDVSALDENLITHFECSIDDGENQIPITSGSLFSLGFTNMECRAVDSFGNQGVKSFEIEVVDTTPPDVLVPEGIKFEGSVPAEGVPIFFEVYANDIVGIEEPPVCHLFDSYSNLQSQVVSGDLFTEGFTPLVCLVDDIFGNTGVASFGIMVINSDTDGDGVNTDTDGDGVNDFFDGCPNDPNKISPGTKGCGNLEPPVELEIPNWIKTTAGWWSERSVDDSDFTGGISYLIEEDIISIPDLPAATEAVEEKVPEWVRNMAGWWADDLTSDQEFVDAIKFLVEKGIIQVQT